MAVAVSRSHLYPTHAVTSIEQFLHIVRFNWFREARPTAVAVELVQRREQRFTRNDVHIDARLVVIPISIFERPFGSVLLCDLELLRREARDGLRVLRVVWQASTSQEKLQIYFTAAKVIGS